MRIFKNCTLLCLIALLLLDCIGGSQVDNDTGNKLKIFRYNQTGGISSLDPAYASIRANVWATSQLYNGLFRFDKSLHTHKDLVVEYHESVDGKAYTFTLRKDVRFHDNACFKGGRGRELLAEDVVFSFKRLLTQGTGGWIFKDKVLTNADGTVSDTCFKAIDEHTLKIYLHRRFPGFLNLLAIPYTFIIPQEAPEYYGEKFHTNPVGTGAFVLSKWEQGKKLTMHKNERYWNHDTKGNRLPYLDSVEISFIEDRNSEFLTFEEGKLEFITNIAENSRDAILEKNGNIKDKIQSNFQVEKIPYLNTEYIGFLLEGTEDKNPFVNPLLRQALSYAINRKGLISFLRNGLGVAAEKGFIHFVLPSYDLSSVKGYAYDMDTALSLLSEAGYPAGKGLPTLKLYTYPTDKEIAVFIRDEWKKLGIKVDVELNQFTQHHQLVQSGKVLLFRGSWIGDYPDAENFLALFYSKNHSPFGPNHTHFKNDTFDKLFEEAHETDDLVKRFEDYAKMDQIVMDYAPVIALYYDELVQLKQPYVVGLEINHMNNLLLETVDFKNKELK